MHYNRSILQLQELWRKKWNFVEYLQNFVNPDSVKGQKPRKSKDSGCQYRSRVDAYPQRHSKAIQGGIDEIHRYRSQDSSHKQIQYFFHEQAPRVRNGQGAVPSPLEYRYVSHPQICGLQKFSRNGMICPEGAYTFTITPTQAFSERHAYPAERKSCHENVF